QGLGFFAPLYNPNMAVHIWAPASTTLTLQKRLGRYLSPPFFPVHLRDLACDLTLHEVPGGDFAVGEFHIASSLLCHPGPTVGYRIHSPAGTLAYLPDHEPALGNRDFPGRAEWTSGYGLAAGADLLIHDAQYTVGEYAERIGWGHSSIDDALRFAGLCEVRRLVTFHHDPAPSDDDIDRLLADAVAAVRPTMLITPTAATD